MTQQMNEKRQALKDLSKAVMHYVEEEQAATVNEALAIHYAMQGHIELKSYRQWKKEGFQVRRGEKALLMWGEPVKATNQEKQSQADKEEFKFFPLAYVFSQKQVDPVEVEAS
jgi:hypothetical protein